MDLSIFLINYNTGTLLEKCLESIFETKGDIRAEIFVGDNGSEDGSIKILKRKFPNIYIKSFKQNSGFTRAINTLLPRGKGDYFLVLHPDLKLLPETLGKMIRFLKNHSTIGIIGGDLYYPDGTPNPCEIMWPGFNTYFRYLYMRIAKRVFGRNTTIGDMKSFYWNHEKTSQVNWVWNACMMVKRDVLESVGYFDEAFHVWYADWDLCKRAKEKGWSSYYLKGARAIHYERHSYKSKNVSEMVRYKIDGWISMTAMTRDRYCFIKKHLGRGQLLAVKVIDVVENLGRFAIASVQKMIRKDKSAETTFVMKVCLSTIQTIINA